MTNFLTKIQVQGISPPQTKQTQLEPRRVRRQKAKDAAHTKKNYPKKNSAAPV